MDKPRKPSIFPFGINFPEEELEDRNAIKTFCDRLHDEHKKNQSIWNK